MSNAAKVIDFLVLKKESEVESWGLEHYEAKQNAQLLKSIGELLDKKFNERSINETYNGKDTHTYIELELEVESLKRKLEANCMSNHKETNTILLGRLDKSYPMHAVKFFISNLIIMFAAIIFGVLSLFSPVINGNNVIIALLIILCNVSLMITSIASVNDWRKKNAFLSKEK